MTINVPVKKKVGRPRKDKTLQDIPTALEAILFKNNKDFIKVVDHLDFGSALTRYIYRYRREAAWDTTVISSELKVYSAARSKDNGFGEVEIAGFFINGAIYAHKEFWKKHLAEKKEIKHQDKPVIEAIPATRPAAFEFKRKKWWEFWR